MTTYITTPIYYVNAQPHLGHAYTTIVADTYSRFKRLSDGEVRFQTGTDEHGDKIAKAAELQGILPKEYVDKISGMFRDTWPLLEVEPDYFIRTTDVDHIDTVRLILQKVYDGGDIYFDEYTGLYCRGCERYLTEKELIDGKCPDHLSAPEEIAEQNYFFKMSRYQQRLIDHIKDNPDFITPERYRNEVLSFLNEPLEDLCISRPKSRLDWGIELPFDNKFVTYVWFDALINYLTGLGYPDGENYGKFWGVAEHVIAKDILKPHAIFWPTMLMAMDVPLYKKLHVHGYWNVDDTKMSKSIGNVLRPRDLVAEYSIDSLRYFILREMSFGLDSSFSSVAIVARHNADLANDLGNLFSRAMAMVYKYRDGVVPPFHGVASEDEYLVDAARVMLADYRRNMEVFAFHQGLRAVWEFISLANKYIVSNEPWVLAREEGQEKRLDAVLYNLLECLRILAMVLGPVMPGAAAKMTAGLALENSDMASLDRGGDWGQMSTGSELKKIEALFPRLEGEKSAKKALQAHKKSAKEQKKAVPAEGCLDFADFQKIDLRVGKVVAAVPVKKSTKLLQLTVDVGEERTVVAGVAEYYQPDELIGRRVIVVCNLKPVKLMGVYSQGMVLAAKSQVDGKEKLVLATVDDSVPSGSKIT